MSVKFLFILFLSLTTVYTMTNQNNEQSFKAIIFDMDGTTLNTEPIWEDANRYILNTYASHLTIDQVNEIIGFRKGIRTPHELAEMLQAHCTPFMPLKEIREIKTNYVHNHYETQAVPFIPFFHEFHEKVIAHGLKTAIATNAEQKSVLKILKSTPLQNYFFEHIYTIDIVNGQYKPNPAIYLHTAKMLGVEPKDCIVIEDSAGGIAAAKAAGMYCIGINTGRNQTLLTEADEIVDCFSEINVENLLSK